MKWAIEIQKTSLEQRNLSDLLKGLGFVIIDGVDSPAFTSATIDACDTACSAFEIAKTVRAAFKGPARVDPEFVLGSVIEYSCEPPRRHAFLEVESLVLRSFVGNATLTVSPPEGLSAEELDQWNIGQAERQYQATLERQRSRLEPAFFSQRATRMLELLGTDDLSGEVIYKIYKLAEGHPDNRSAFQSKYGISKTDFDRFSDAVHNPTVSGDWARHAYHKPPKSANPMSRVEAERFVRDIAARWLQQVRISKKE